MKRTITLLTVFITAIIVLAACGGSRAGTEDLVPAPTLPVTVMAEAPSATPLPTETPTPLPTDTPVPPTQTPEPTPIALGDIDLESLLIRPNDLPSGLSGGQVSDILPERYRNLPDTTGQIRQEFEGEGRTRGGVEVLLYSSPSRLEAAYRLIEAELGDPKYEPSIKITRESVEGVGEHAVGSTMESNLMGVRFDSGELLFVRCHALVNIRMPTSRLQEIEGYGRRLDQRLIPAVCIENEQDWIHFDPNASGSNLTDSVYALMALRYVQNIEADLNDLLALVDSASQNPMLAFDDTWTAEMSRVGIRLWSDADLIPRLAPPERYTEFHSKLLEATSLLGDYGKTIAEGVAAGDPTAMTETISNLWDGKAKFEALAAQVNELRQSTSK